MVPGPTTHARGEGKKLLGEALSAVRETGSAHPASSSGLRICTANARTKESRPRRNRVVKSGQRSQNFLFGVSDLFLGRVGQLNAVEVCR